jgi:hypothetical protein
MIAMILLTGATGSAGSFIANESVNAVKAHLARGRARLKEINAKATPAKPAPRPPSPALMHTS